MVWNEISKIDFYSYPDTITSCTWGLEYEYKFDVTYDYILNTQTGFFEIDSLNPDTIWEIPFLFCNETTPHSEYSLAICQVDKFKKVEWEYGSIVYTDNKNMDKFVINHKVEKLFKAL